MQQLSSFDLKKMQERAAKKVLEKQPTYITNSLVGREFEKDKFIAYASKLIKRNFEIDAKNQKVVATLWDYFFNPAKFDKENENTDYSSGKGIMLYGEPGSGKSEIMRIFCNLVKGIAEVEFIFARFYTLSGKVEELGNQAFKPNRNHILFDELGLERCKAIKRYGASIDVDEEIILMRYDEFRNGTVTHFTTNLAETMIKARYNPRVLSRLNEMCNLMRLTGVDRRATARPIRNY